MRNHRHCRRLGISALVALAALGIFVGPGAADDSIYYCGGIFTNLPCAKGPSRALILPPVRSDRSKLLNPAAEFPRARMSLGYFSRAHPSQEQMALPPRRIPLPPINARDLPYLRAEAAAIAQNLDLFKDRLGAGPLRARLLRLEADLDRICTQPSVDTRPFFRSRCLAALKQTIQTLKALNADTR